MTDQRKTAGGNDSLRASGGDGVKRREERARVPLDEPDEPDAFDRLDRALQKAVRAERARAGLTQAELAERWGVTRDVVNKVEQGTRRVRGSDLPGLCRALDAPVWRLYVEADPDELLALGYRLVPRAQDVQTDERPPPGEG